MVATAQVQSDYDFVRILELAGAPEGCAPVLLGNTLTVEELSQDSLDAALAAYDHSKTVARQQREQFKRLRAEAVEAIAVTTMAGHTFDGDETSQGRMGRAIACMVEGDTVPWVLADNSVIQATRGELIEALRMSGAAQAILWVQS